MVIIVEGIDRVGKTTLVNMLHNATGFPVYKNNTSFRLEDMDNENETDKMIKMLQVCQLTNASIIFDRFHWTDAVYGVIHRGYDPEKALANVRQIEKVLVNMDALVILVNPTNVGDSSVQHGCDLRGHDKLFAKLFSGCKVDAYACNYHSLDYAVTWAFKKTVDRWCKR